MFGEFRHRVHHRGVLFNTVERTVLTTSALVIAVLTLPILFFGIYLRVV
jgi:hypothetical protein